MHSCASCLDSVIETLPTSPFGEARTMISPLLEIKLSCSLDQVPSEGNRTLVVPGHQVGDRRLTGGRPPSAVCRRRVL